MPICRPAQEGVSLLKTHCIKIRKKFADEVVAHRKTFEIRNNDRNYHKGDIIKFQAVDNKTGIPIGHKINHQKWCISYLLSGWGLEPGFVVFSIKEITK
jgi:hypothetical protein